MLVSGGLMMSERWEARGWEGSVVLRRALCVCVGRLLLWLALAGC